MEQENQGSMAVTQSGGGQFLQPVNYKAEIAQIKAQKEAMDELVRDVLKDGVHFGIVPGCGKKPALLKPGAEALLKLFRLVPKLDTKIEELGNGHREFTTVCSLYYRDEPVGNASASCSTMEAKYRYRYVENTGKPLGQVPREYWELRKSGDEAGMNKIKEVFGRNVRTTKIDGSFYFVDAADKEKTENPDIADTYNTVRKMSEKRALVAAVLIVTGASDKFTQDIEEMNAQAADAAKVESESTAAKAKAETEKKAAEKQPEKAEAKQEKKGEDKNAPSFTVAQKTKLYGLLSPAEKAKLVEDYKVYNANQFGSLDVAILDPIFAAHKEALK